jgi:uroporphyrinogen decarboxylase
MTPRERVLRTLAHEQTDIVPYTIEITQPVDEALVAHYGSPAYRERIVQHYAVLSPGFTGVAETLPDGTFRDVFGGRWEAKNILHQLEYGLKEPSLEALLWPDVSKEEYYQPLREAAAKMPGRFTIAAFAFGLFERSWGMRGMNNILMDMACEPAFCDQLYDRITEMNLVMLEKMCDTAVDAVGFTDDLGSQKGLIMGPIYWRRYLKPRMSTLIGYIKSRGKFAYLHTCGDNTDIMDDLVDMGLDIFNPLQPEPWDIFTIKRRYGKYLTFDGGISSQSALQFGTADEVRNEVQRCLRELGKGGGYIAGPNKPLLPGTPIENAVALIETLTNQ